MASNITLIVSTKLADTTKEALKFTHFVQDVLAEPSRTYEREIVMGIMLALYVSTQFAKLVLPPLFPRIRTIIPGRQRQMFTLWPMMVLKLSVCYLMAEAEYASRFRLGGLYHAKPIDLLQHQGNIFYILILGYIFELLYRPNPIELDYHHVFAVIGYTYYRIRFAHSSGVEAATSNLFHLAIVMVIYGVGPVDLASEGMRFVYYAIEPKAWSTQVMRLCVGVAWAGRLAQWYVMLEHLGRSVVSLIEAWSWIELTLCAVFIAYWIWMETVELFFMFGLSKRYAAKVVGHNKSA